MWAHRLRRWPHIKSVLVQRLVFFSGLPLQIQKQLLIILPLVLSEETIGGKFLLLKLCFSSYCWLSWIQTTTDKQLMLFALNEQTALYDYLLNKQILPSDFGFKNLLMTLLTYYTTVIFSFNYPVTLVFLCIMRSLWTRTNSVICICSVAHRKMPFC